MSRHSSSSSTNQGIQQFGPDDYRLFWTVDFYYSGSRLRFPRQFSRDTDLAGARRFAKKWNLTRWLPGGEKALPEKVS